MANCNVDIPVADFRQADIVFRLGRTIQSSAIASQGAGGYSHIGILIEVDSALQVLHIEPSRQASEKIKTETLPEFFSAEQAVAGCVVRHSGISEPSRAAIADYAKYLLNSDISFDHDYLLSDSSRMYCTELVERIYHRVGISLSQEKKIRLPLAKEPVILPSAIYENDSLVNIWSYRAD
ncbi:MAG: hypothetical protein IKU88_00065 [Alistipes sp.]|nr:hypothetical protein [Alistipes sp.]